MGPSFVLEVLVLVAQIIYYFFEALVRSCVPRKYRSKSVNGEIVLITGGGGGLGRLLALRFAKLGAVIVVWDIKQKELDDTVRLVQQAGGTIYGFVCDVTDRHKIYAAAAHVKKEIGNVSILVNNAGVASGRTLLDIPDAMIERTYQVNILAHYWTSKAFLPDMVKANHGHVVTVSSMSALSGFYKGTDYSASKFATLGFHESLYAELQTHGHDGIHLTIVLPYYMDTGMFPLVNPRVFPMLRPENVADEVVAATLANEYVATVPRTARWIYPLKSIVPAKIIMGIYWTLFETKKSILNGIQDAKRKAKVQAN